jgi:hypothetical protein
MSVMELEAEVTKLTAEELDKFNMWYEEYVADQWDRQIETDILAGKLDAMGERASADFAAGRCTPL